MVGTNDETDEEVHDNPDDSEPYSVSAVDLKRVLQALDSMRSSGFRVFHVSALISNIVLLARNKGTCQTGPRRSLQSRACCLTRSDKR